MQPKLIFKIDSAIIGFVEKFAHWFQKLTGKTNFFLAGAINGVLLVPCFIAIMRGTDLFNPMNPQPEERTTFDYIILFFLICIFSESALFGWKKDEDAAWKRLTQGLANPKKSSFTAAMVRMCIVLLCSLLTAFALEEGNLISAAITSLFLLGSYLESCDPLPPCQGKIKEWLGSLFARRATEPG